MSCIVRQIGSKTVSWVRKFDSAILSVDDMLVTFDDRISLEKISYLSQWSLNIRSAMPSDSGQYECQVSAEPKLSKIVNLSVKVPKLAIDGSPSILASAGSNITLKCTVKGVSHASNISWFYQNVDGSKSKLKEDKQKIVQTGPGSWVLVRVGPDSAGNYSCSTHTSNTAIVTINVVDGERIPEAMLEEELKGYTSFGTNLLISTTVILPLQIALFMTSQMILLLFP